MPELGEVAHAAKLLSKHLAGKRISKLQLETDTIVFPSQTPEIRSQIEKRYATKKIVDVGRHGKYFWIVLNDSQAGSKRATAKKMGSAIEVMLLHLGMTGWVHIRDVNSNFFPMEASKDGEKPEGYDEKKKKEGWPPRFSKFLLTAEDGLEFSFTDPRRLARVRFLEIDSDMKSSDEGDIMSAAEEALKKIEPLCRSGKDFSKRDSRLSEEEFTQIVSKRKVPVKSLLLDQAVCAGIGNWMADEILFQSRVHPEQYSNTIPPSTQKLLYEKLCEISEYTVTHQINAFPKSWLMKHRWSKRSKKGERPKTADGYTVDFVTVGGRTSCFVPELQMLTSPESEISEETTEVDVKVETKKRTVTASSEVTEKTTKRRGTSKKKIETTEEINSEIETARPVRSTRTRKARKT
ncbi:Formamidopyrimidine-DNA glycosylase N-terminal domain-containing protein [Myxozyma melibiosi]|uniref:Formamidopyrimidine-DNA glycosylase N-terminal domain-containing protein n=1 Tax=Myxozyma melibiosi TaxID=54550 RepID=A0ABR1F3Q4_9ASCO